MHDKLRYNSFNSYLKKKYGCKIYRIPVISGFSCPNRDGTKSTGGCIYCDNTGSGADYYPAGLNEIEQVRYSIEKFSKSRKAEKFFVYFQAFSNTYNKEVEYLKKLYESVFINDKIAGLIVGTRPDCVNEDIMKILGNINKNKEVWIEYGLQSIHPETLAWLNRQHTLKDFEDAFNIAHLHDIKVTAHIITGLPVETREQMIDTGKYLGKIKVDGIKIHSLYILKGTELEKRYYENKFKLLAMDEYIDTVVAILEVLHPETIIHRLTGENSRDKVIAPLWIFDKSRIINTIQKKLEERDSRQGKRWEENFSG